MTPLVWAVAAAAAAAVRVRAAKLARPTCDAQWVSDFVAKGGIRHLLALSEKWSSVRSLAPRFNGSCWLAGACATFFSCAGVEPRH
eukprot:COSAG01_NODE_792_length_13554_cov_13.811891_2_plen_86_part_00